jgi:hypothetical protein
MGQGFDIVRNWGNDEFGLAKESKSFKAYPFICEPMAQEWNPSFDQYFNTTAAAIPWHRRLSDGISTAFRRLDEEAPKGSNKVMVVLQTEIEEPVVGDSSEFVSGNTQDDGNTGNSGDYNDGWGNGSGEVPWWVYFVIVLLSLICAALLALLIWCCMNRKREEPEQGPKKQIYVYRSQSQKERWEKIKKEEARAQREKGFSKNGKRTPSTPSHVSGPESV